MKKENKKVGRPAKNIIEPIKDTPENVAKIIMNSKPKKQWEYIKE